MLTLVFRSVAAMALTLISALIALAGGLLLLQFASAFADFPSFAPTLGVMLGLGAGIDYALLIVGRYREQLASGDSVGHSARVANATAGTSVVAAGAIVVVAIAGLLATGIPFVGRMGIGSAIIIATVAVGAVTVLPTLMGAFARRLRPKRPEHVEPSQRFARWAGMITRRPLVAADRGRARARPARHAVRLAAPRPARRRQRQRRLDHPRRLRPARRGLRPRLQRPARPGRHHARRRLGQGRPEPRPAGRGGGPRRGLRIPGAALAGRRRRGPERDPEELAPGRAHQPSWSTGCATTCSPRATRGSQVDVYVGGATATLQDLADKIAGRLPIFIAMVVGLSVLLLMAVFRSLWVPLVSAAFNLLSIAAAYGVVVLVFQQGVGSSLLGVDGEVPIVSFVPLFMFAILFGLSMDYNVFLQSRIREEYMRGAGPQQSVVRAMSRVGRIILAAGVIMTSVFLGFVSDPDVVVKTIGLGLAAAILIDVLVVRMVVAPAVMTLLGDRAWTLPAWLDRVLPRISLEGDAGHASGPPRRGRGRSRAGSVNRTGGHEEAPLGRRGARASLISMYERRGYDQTINRLIDRLKKLVAEQRRLERRGRGAQLEALRREIDRPPAGSRGRCSDWSASCGSRRIRGLRGAARELDLRRGDLDPRDGVAGGGETERDPPVTARHVDHRRAGRWREQPRRPPARPARPSSRPAARQKRATMPVWNPTDQSSATRVSSTVN